MTTTTKLVMLALLSPGLMLADLLSGACSSSDICTYSITGTGLDITNAPPTEDTTRTWNLTFEFLGPEMYNAADNTLLSFNVTGTPVDGWTYDPGASGLSAYAADGDALVTFDDPNSATDGLGVASVTYYFYATDAFWATTGNNIAFGATDDITATSGAYFQFVTDPPCTACTVTITATSAVPEPKAILLFATMLAITVLFYRSRNQAAAKRP